jgi:hypothetical protein
VQRGSALDGRREPFEHDAGAPLRSRTIGHEVIVPVTAGRLDPGPRQRVVLHGESDGQQPKPVSPAAMGASAVLTHPHGPVYIAGFATRRLETDG